MTTASVITANADIRSIQAQASHRRATTIATSPISHMLPDPTRTYLTGTYPPLKALGAVAVDELFTDVSDVLNLYIHIPFCMQRCTFCHFSKEIKASQDRVQTYLTALHAEIDLVVQRIGTRRLASVYIGGGTPSTLQPYEIRALFNHLRSAFTFDEATETTFELHPQIMTDPILAEAKLAALSDSGVNRIAFGVQSLDPGVLRILNRGHGPDEVFQLLDALAAAGLTNVSVDLMYGLPYETLDSWQDTVRSLVDHGVEKLNIFPLFFKVTDPISLLYSRKPEVFPNQVQRLAAHHLAEELLFEQGFVRGPALYYSKQNHHSRQQEMKFDAIDEVNLLGLGVSAFGFLGGTQYYNSCDLSEYVAMLSSGQHPLWRGTTLNDDELARRSIMFGLRSAGVSRAAFQRRFGSVPEQFLHQIGEFAGRGLLQIVDDRWVATDIGAYCLDTMSQQFASPAVIQRVSETNATIGDRRTSLLEQHDYSPLGRDLLSIPTPRPAS